MNILKNQGGLLSSHVAPPVSWLLVIHGERIVRHCGRHSVPLRPAWSLQFISGPSFPFLTEYCIKFKTKGVLQDFWRSYCLELFVHVCSVSGCFATDKVCHPWSRAKLRKAGFNFQSHVSREVPQCDCAAMHEDFAGYRHANVSGLPLSLPCKSQYCMYIRHCKNAFYMLLFLLYYVFFFHQKGLPTRGSYSFSKKGRMYVSEALIWQPYLHVLSFVSQCARCFWRCSIFFPFLCLCARYLGRWFCSSNLIYCLSVCACLLDALADDFPAIGVPVSGFLKEVYLWRAFTPSTKSMVGWLC